MNDGGCIEYPPTWELKEVMRAIRNAAPTAHHVHGDIVWRVRRGEVITTERLLQALPFLTEPLITRYIGELRQWGLIPAAELVLQLVELRT